MNLTELINNLNASRDKLTQAIKGYEDQFKQAGVEIEFRIENHPTIACVYYGKDSDKWRLSVEYLNGTYKPLTDASCQEKIDAYPAVVTLFSLLPSEIHKLQSRIETVLGE